LVGWMNYSQVSQLIDQLSNLTNRRAAEAGFSAEVNSGATKLTIQGSGMLALFEVLDWLVVRGVHRYKWWAEVDCPHNVVSIWFQYPRDQTLFMLHWSSHPSVIIVSPQLLQEWKQGVRSVDE
jgi:hypothetical protein